MTVSPLALTRITIRPLGSPLPIGFMAFGAGVLLMSAFEAGWISPAEQSTLGIAYLAFVAPLEVFAMVFGFLARDTGGGTTMGLFSASWLVWGLRYLAAPPGGSHVIAIVVIALAASALILGSVSLASRPFFSVILYLAATRFGLVAAHELGAGRTASEISAVLGLALTALSFYGALALLLEESAKHSVLPMFRRGRAKAAIERGFVEQIADVAHEPGVREAL